MRVSTGHAGSRPVNEYGRNRGKTDSTSKPAAARCSNTVTWVNGST